MKIFIVAFALNKCLSFLLFQNISNIGFYELFFRLSIYLDYKYNIKIISLNLKFSINNSMLFSQILTIEARYWDELLKTQ